MAASEHFLSVCHFFFAFIAVRTDMMPKSAANRASTMGAPLQSFYPPSLYGVPTSVYPFQQPGAFPGPYAGGGGAGGGAAASAGAGAGSTAAGNFYGERFYLFDMYKMCAKELFFPSKAIRAVPPLFSSSALQLSQCVVTQQCRICICGAVPLKLVL